MAVIQSGAVFSSAVVGRRFRGAYCLHRGKGSGRRFEVRVVVLGRVRLGGAIACVSQRSLETPQGVAALRHVWGCVRAATPSGAPWNVLRNALEVCTDSA